MKHTGRPVLWMLVLLAALVAQLAQGAVEATVDRTRIAMGDTLQLVISATEDDEELADIKLDGLLRDWELLSRSTRSNTTIVNGKRNHERQLQLEITPRREGALTIPAFQVGAGRTREVLVEVGAAPKIDPGAEHVLFEASVDRESVYVQGQLLLTLRLQQAVNLDGRSISDLELPGAFVVPLFLHFFWLFASSSSMGVGRKVSSLEEIFPHSTQQPKSRSGARPMNCIL